MPDELYHEKQRLLLSALHTLNNLFQDRYAFTRSELDRMCCRLSQNFTNPHKSFFGIGSYDIDVINDALKGEGYSTVCFEKSDDPKIIKFGHIFGFIVREKCEWKIFGFSVYESDHWYGLILKDGVMYDMDSRLEAPEVIGDSDDARNYLRDILGDGNKRLFVVAKQEVVDKNEWRIFE